jgi:hypothetical protein
MVCDNSIIAADIFSSYCTGLPDTEIPDRPQGMDALRALALHSRGLELACGHRTGGLYIPSIIHILH